MKTLKLVALKAFGWSKFAFAAKFLLVAGGVAAAAARWGWLNQHIPNFQGHAAIVTLVGLAAWLIYHIASFESYSTEHLFSIFIPKHHR